MSSYGCTASGQFSGIWRALPSGQSAGGHTGEEDAVLAADAPEVFVLQSPPPPVRALEPSSPRPQKGRRAGTPLLCRPSTLARAPSIAFALVYFS